ncbi:hypothetical protein [Coleofasciculus sp. FACHB-1120]|uniref:hypothetical protein n=1 Tax=Coleofasciculus sp. FACHB-1120 TaxID=2692783 RepID=UPI00168A186B|nr:hypothetical protein [Coleofasciculus sp. FACHB-1120]MBD2743446.1 hypothetical protein [Coleofasciculus sp. FACHB-1120]
MEVHRRLRDEIGQSNNATSSVLTVNIDWRECGCRLEADAVGDKAVVGTAATVEQNLTESEPNRRARKSCPIGNG